MATVRWKVLLPGGVILLPPRVGMVMASRPSSMLLHRQASSIIYIRPPQTFSVWGPLQACRPAPRCSSTSLVLLPLLILRQALPKPPTLTPVRRLLPMRLRTTDSPFRPANQRRTWVLDPTRLDLWAIRQTHKPA